MSQSQGIDLFSLYRTEMIHNCVWWSFAPKVVKSKNETNVL